MYQMFGKKKNLLYDVHKIDGAIGRVWYAKLYLAYMHLLGVML